MDEPLLKETLKQKWLDDPTELTTRRWNNIKDTVVGYMQQIHNKRTAVARAEELEPHVNMLRTFYDRFLRSPELSRQPVNQFPHFADMCLMPEMVEFLRGIVDGEVEVFWGALNAKSPSVNESERFCACPVRRLRMTRAPWSSRERRGFR